jgi:hypothetical protein
VLILKPAATAAGVGWCGFHTFRHTCATLLFRNGLNGKQVQVWLGHHVPGFALRTYVHLLPDDLVAPAFLDEMMAWDGSPGGSQTGRDGGSPGEPDAPATALA